MRNTLLTLIILVLFAVTLVTAEKVELGTQDDYVNIVVQESNDLRTVVRFEVGAFDKDAVDVGGDIYYAIGCGKEAILLNEGEPALPRFCRSIIIPDDAKMSIEVLSAEYVDFPNTPVVPSKGNLPRTVNPDDVPYTFGSVYAASEWYPEELASIRSPYILRDYRGTVIELNAFQYHPVKQTLRVYTSVTVEVANIGPGETNVLKKRRHADKLVPDFDLIYQRRFINYDFGERYTPVMESGDMLVITYDAFHAAMQPFVEWKLQKGIKTTVVDVSVIGNNANSIKGFIQGFYDTTNLAWVLLVGDAAQVATPYSYGGASDPSYVKLAGGDNYPDAFVGRFSAESVSHVETQVERIIAYERDPMVSDWLHKGTGIASTEGPGHHGEYDHEHMALIRDNLLAFTYTEVDELYGPSATAAQVTSALNEGRSIINYCGHGGSTYWVTTGFDNNDINNLTNTSMLPFIISVACVNGNFPTLTCFGETWLRATHNGEPTGAIGAYMSSIDQSWNPPMDAQDEAIDLLIAEEKTTFGGICFNGSCKMIDINGGGGVAMYDTWHIFGDPSVLLRTDLAAPLSVNHEPVMLIDMTEFEVEVVGEEGALCAIYHGGTLYGAAYTGADGMATIPLNKPLPTGENVTLTVTAFNALCYITAIPVITPDGPYLLYDGHEVNDAAGNNNGVVEYGESILLGVQLKNIGPDTCYNVQVTLTTDDSLITITDGFENYGSIAGSSGTGFVADGFAFDVDFLCPMGHQAVLQLDVSGDNEYATTLTFEIAVGERLVFFVDDFSADQGWGGLGGSGEWTIGPATGGSGGDSFGGPDPDTDHTLMGDNGVLGNDLTPGYGGDYDPNLSTTYWVTSPVIDCSDHTGVIMNFYRWLGVDSPSSDHAMMEVYDGTTWITVFKNEDAFDESSWTEMEYDLSIYADENPDFQIRFGIGPTNAAYHYCGWNIDDISLKGYALLYSCGDIDANSEGPNVADLTYLIDYLFHGGTPPPIMEMANVDGVGGINVVDVAYLTAYLFDEGPAPDCQPVR